MQVKTVKLEVRGGVAYVVKCPKGCRVMVMDYDADNAKGYTRYVVNERLDQTEVN